MKHRTKKKGHGHSKHKHKSSTSVSHDGEASQAPSSHSPRSSNATAKNPATDNTRRGSMCEYCGAAPQSTDGYDDDNFDCADDCERFSAVDVNAVTCTSAYQLRSPLLTAFYCQSGAVLSEIHALIRPSPTSENARAAFNESAVLKIRPKLLALFTDMWRLGVGHGALASSLSSPSPPSPPSFDPEDDGEDAGNVPYRGPTCPFVMVLSVLLPALHKFLQWAQHTKPHWWLGGPGASFTASGALELLATQLQFHDLLAQVTAEGDRLVQVIGENEERDQDVSRLAQQQQPPTPRRSGGYSSSSSSSSLASSTSRPGSANDRNGAPRRLPQIRKISFEFEEWLAESKFELAELSEAMQENVEITALRLSRFPPLGEAIAGQQAKSKRKASEFVEGLMKLVLVPLGDRVVGTPSASRSYIFPRVFDRCIGVAIDEYATENGKWNAENASQFEKAIELFRSWALGVDAEYDKQLINAPRDVARLGLSTMDAFRRLDILLHSWVRQGKDGESYVPRLTFKTNLENLRSTLKKTMTARGGGHGTPGLSGLATPPPVQ